MFYNDIQCNSTPKQTYNYRKKIKNTLIMIN